jgi:hypothetical protein
VIGTKTSAWLLVGPAAIGAGAAIIGILIGGLLQGRRDDRRWRREQVATAYADAQTHLRQVIWKACQAFDVRVRKGEANYGELVDEAARLKDELNGSMDRVQLLGSRQVCRVVAKIMPVVERVLFALDLGTPLTEPTARQLCAGGMVALKDFTDACRQDLGVKGKSGYDPSIAETNSEKEATT